MLSIVIYNVPVHGKLKNPMFIKRLSVSDIQEEIVNYPYIFPSFGDVVALCRFEGAAKINFFDDF